MPMAKKESNTVARLAMGTAMLTIVSGCDSIGKSYNDLSLSITGGPVLMEPKPPLISLPVVTATTTVGSTEYVAPGAPTYTEASQAENVQTFESVYGAPLTGTDIDTQVASDAYTIPSYNDGSVIAQPLSAPAALPLASVEQPTYAQQVTTAIAPTYDLAPASAGQLVYGESLTSTSYEITTAPAGTVVQDAMVAPTVLAPLEATGATLSYGDPIPMTDAAAVSIIEPLTSEYAAPAIAQPVAGAGFVVVPSYQSAPAPYGGAVEIITNDEAVTTYDLAPVPAPVSGGLGDQSAAPVETSPVAQLSDFFKNDATSFSSTAIEVTALPAPELFGSPLPRQKADISAVSTDTSLVMAPVPRSRPNFADRRYAAVTAPLPQPRPTYTKPMVVATTSSSFVSIGSLDTEILSAPPGAADAAMTMVDESGVATIAGSATDGSVVEVARAQMPVPVAPGVKEPAGMDPQSRKGSPFSELSGTSWQLTNIFSVSGLSGTSWRLKEGSAMAISANTELHFDGASGFAGGQGPCNSYGGEYTNSGENRFSMTNIFSTRTSCPDIALERTYLDTLKKAGSYKIATDFSVLTLLDVDGREIAQFKAF